MIKLLFQTVYLSDMVFSILTRTFDFCNDRSLFIMKDCQHRYGQRRNIFQTTFGQSILKTVTAQYFGQRVIVNIELLIPNHLCRQCRFGHRRTQQTGD